MAPPIDDPGPARALARAAATLIETLETRIELAGLELGEARARLLVGLVAGFAAMLLAAGAVTALSAWVAAALWPRFGPQVLAWIALAYAVASAAVLVWLRWRRLREPAVLGDTLAELRNDAAALRGATRRAP